MPPRKSTASAQAASPEDGAKPEPKGKDKDETLSVEDLNLPKSIVQRLAKGVLPPNTQIQKDALLAMSKSATVFVNYLTHHAAETAFRNNKKTVTPGDVFDAMHDLEFDAFVPRLEAEVNKFTSIQADKRNSYRKKVREEKKAAKETGEGNSTMISNGNAADDSPPAKRARRSSVDGGEHNGGEDDEAGEGPDETAEVEEPEPEEDEVEEEEEGEDEAGEEGEGLTEDPLEVREDEPSDDDMADESD